MPSYSAPPPAPWIPRPESAFNPIRAWLPSDHGPSFREFVRGDHAPITGTAAWGVGSYGRCFAGNGSSYGVSGTFPAADAVSVTVTHISGANPFRGLVGWGSNFQGILYSGPRISLIDSNTAERFSANLTAPTASWRVITLTLAGHAIGSAGEFWVDGARVSSGTISSAAGTLSAATQFWIGAVRGGTNPWQAGIGPVYLHDRVLSGKEIAALHADPWRILRDFRWQTGRRVAAVPPPLLIAGVGQVAPATAAGSLIYYREISGVGVIAPASAAGSLVAYREISGAGVIAPAGAVGSIDGFMEISGVGVIAPAGASGAVIDNTPEPGVLQPWLLDQLAVIESRGRAVDADGAPMPSWSTVHGAAPCRLTEMSERELANQQRDGRQADHWIDFDGDWSRLVPKDGRITIDGRVFGVVGVTAVRGPGYVAYTAVKCREFAG